MSPSSQSLRDLLAGVRTIAIVGLSANPERPSNEVAAFLAARGYHCIGVNPGLAGRRIHGMPVVGRLADIGHAIDMVDIFRAAEAVEAVVDDALVLDPKPRVIWMQLGVINRAAATKVTEAGLVVVMNNCPKIVLGLDGGQ